ncbi:hypothetical protein DFQ29_008758 [Apophysomyces sp. BC1021]|nr:hypothetical protein DFQ29_008758 [Apophysomyces sp. BC1021]
MNARPPAYLMLQEINFRSPSDKKTNKKKKTKTTTSLSPGIVLNVKKYTEQFEQYRKNRELLIAERIKREAHLQVKVEVGLPQDRSVDEYIDWDNINFKPEQNGVETEDLLELWPSDGKGPISDTQYELYETREEQQPITPHKSVSAQVAEYTTRTIGPITERTLVEIAFDVKRDPRLRASIPDTAPLTVDHSEAVRHVPNPLKDTHWKAPIVKTSPRNTDSPKVLLPSQENIYSNSTGHSSKSTPADVIRNLPPLSVPICATAHQIAQCSEILTSHNGTRKILFEKMMNILNYPLDVCTTAVEMEKCSGKILFLRKLLELFSRNHMDVDIVIMVFDMSMESILCSYIRELGYLHQRISTVADNWRREYGLFVSSRSSTSNGRQALFSLKADLLIAFDVHIVPNDDVFSQIECPRKIWLTTLGSVEERMRKYMDGKRMEYGAWKELWSSDPQCEQILLEQNTWPSLSDPEHAITYAAATVGAWVKSGAKTDYVYQLEPQSYNVPITRTLVARPASAILLGKKRHAIPGSIDERPPRHTVEESHQLTGKRPQQSIPEDQYSMTEKRVKLGPDEPFSVDLSSEASFDTASPPAREQEITDSELMKQSPHRQPIHQAIHTTISAVNDSLPPPQPVKKPHVVPAFSNNLLSAEVRKLNYVGSNISPLNNEKMKELAGKHIKEALAIPLFPRQSTKRPRITADIKEMRRYRSPSVGPSSTSSDEEYFSASDSEISPSALSANENSSMPASKQGSTTPEQPGNINNDYWSHRMNTVLEAVKERYNKECDGVMERLRKTYEEEMAIISKKYQDEAMRALYP